MSAVSDWARVDDEASSDCIWASKASIESVATNCTARIAWRRGAKERQSTAKKLRWGESKENQNCFDVFDAQDETEPTQIDKSRRSGLALGLLVG